VSSGVVEPMERRRTVWHNRHGLRADVRPPHAPLHRPTCACDLAAAAATYDAAMGMLKPGVPGEAVDGAARSVLREYQLERFMIHPVATMSVSRFMSAPSSDSTIPTSWQRGML
jgi:hypothetical protein